jgi:hypothetical protein
VWLRDDVRSWKELEEGEWENEDVLWEWPDDEDNIVWLVRDVLLAIQRCLAAAHKVRAFHSYSYTLQQSLQGGLCAGTEIRGVQAF